MTPRSVPPTRECHWCGGARAPWGQRMAWRAELALRLAVKWLRERHECCPWCDGKGRRA